MGFDFAKARNCRLWNNRKLAVDQTLFQKQLCKDAPEKSGLGKEEWTPLSLMISKFPKLLQNSCVIFVFQHNLVISMLYPNFGQNYFTSFYMLLKSNYSFESIFAKT